MTLHGCSFLHVLNFHIFFFSHVILKSLTTNSSIPRRIRSNSSHLHLYIASYLYSSLFILSMFDIACDIDWHVCFGNWSLRFKLEKWLRGMKHFFSKEADWERHPRRGLRVTKGSMGIQSQRPGGINARTAWIAADCPCRIPFLPSPHFLPLFHGKECFPTKRKISWNTEPLPLMLCNSTLESLRCWIKWERG